MIISDILLEVTILEMIFEKIYSEFMNLSVNMRILPMLVLIRMRFFQIFKQVGNSLFPWSSFISK